MGDGLLHFARGDLVEHHALDLLVLERLLLAQQFDQMPGDGFAFAVGVGRQDQGVGLPELLGDGVDVLGVLVDHLVLHLEAARRIDRAVFRHQVAHVAVRGQDFVVLAEILLDRLRLGRRFDDDQVFAHRDGNGAASAARGAQLIRAEGRRCL
jgi:hypothetical protein